MNRIQKFCVLLGAAIVSVSCSQVDRAVDKVADKAAEANDRAVEEYRDRYCTATGCVVNRLTCQLPLGATVRILNRDQLEDVQAFVLESNGRC